MGEIAPIKTWTSKRTNNSWFTTTIRSMVRLKNKMFNKFRKVKTPTAWTNYKNIKNEVTNAIHTEKRTHLEYVLKAHKKDSKMLWRKLIELGIHKKTFHSILPDKLNNPDKINNFFWSFRAWKCLIGSWWIFIPIHY
ncbi:hypothetical protein WA026_021391 [Henosepilachna vigintioctopunctata]|uniref:Uncharacterized protein n=1 Tax=Henosepilachna vigintioctopunctata TaxID=420089 RepID=A0AAW1TS44_9CUCU